MSTKDDAGARTPQAQLALALPPIGLSFLLAIPLGWLANRYGWLRGPLLTGAGLTYAIPSLPLVAVVADEQTARTLRKDLQFFLHRGHNSDDPAASDAVIGLPELDVTPWADASPERAAVLSRMSTLFRLSQGSVLSAQVVVASLKLTQTPAQASGACPATQALPSGRPSAGACTQTAARGSQSWPSGHCASLPQVGRQTAALLPCKVWQRRSARPWHLLGSRASSMYISAGPMVQVRRQRPG